MTLLRQIEATLPEPPSANRYWRSVGGRVLVSREGREYKERVAMQLVRTEPFAGPVIVRLDWYRSRKSGDLDNRLKIALDALKGSCYGDDSQVVEIRARRFDDKDRPRIEITVVEMPSSTQARPPEPRTGS